MNDDVRNFCCLVAGIAATGTAIVLVSRWAARSSAASSGVESGGTYYEKKLAQARRDQERQREKALQDRERSYQQAIDFGDTGRFERSAERRTGAAERLEERTARRTVRDVEELGLPEELAGFVHVGNTRGPGEREQSELQAARKVHSAAKGTTSSAKSVRVARGHELKAAKAMRKSGQGSKEDVKAARVSLKGAREGFRTAVQVERAAKQTVHQERAEARAGRRQERAQEVEEGIETSITDFQPSTPDERIYLSRGDVYETDPALYPGGE